MFDVALTQSQLTVAMHGKAILFSESYHVRANLGQPVCNLAMNAVMDTATDI